ncbi:MAG: glycosyltransferase family A protein [Planctomycetales bacterium]
MTQPKISTIIPCYNQARFLPEVVETLRRQTFADWEGILVNDGSTDETERVAQNLFASEPRLRLVTQQNRGLSGARNTGCREARGTFLHFLDADDLLHERAYEWLMRGANAKPGATILMRYATFSEGAERDLVPVLDQPLEQAFLPGLITRNLGPVHAYLVPRELVFQAGGFDASFPACEDWDLWLRIALQGGLLVSIPEVGAYYRRYAGSMSSDPMRMLGGWLPTHIRAWQTLSQRENRADLIREEVQQLRLALVKATLQLLTAGEINSARRLEFVTRKFFPATVAEHGPLIGQALRWLPYMTVGKSLRLSAADRPRMVALVARVEDWLTNGVPYPTLGTQEEKE